MTDPIPQEDELEDECLPLDRDNLTEEDMKNEMRLTTWTDARSVQRITRLAKNA